MNDQYIIRTSGISYRYSNMEKVLIDINLEVPRGVIYGFLGPNGSGKTTTLSLLLGLLRQQQGEIRIFGDLLNKNRIKILKQIGSLIESPSLYRHLSAKENLEVYRNLYEAPKGRVDEVLNIVGLENTKSKTVKNFSLGMKQRLAIALTLLHKPELLILDEPTNGLDPNGIIELRQLIKRLNKDEGTTILISSHILTEVEKMVTHIGIINHGTMPFQGPVEELQLLQKNLLLLRTSNDDLVMDILSAYVPKRENGCILLSVQDERQLTDINKLLSLREIDIYHLQPKRHDLEQLFIDITSIKS